ncbi:MAG: type I restriction enzyme HsdR N-terminal domain-containing protein [Bacteroidales bacterium]|nr:type I restriction enzyme HsdR N-terminal domain-containing protein [Bacteroidales bacterium]
MTMSSRRPSIETRETEGRREVLDIVRHRWVALTPEEWVRQQVVHRLHYELGYPLELMQVEGAITLNGMTRRCDIVVYDSGVHPMMIVECKREDVPLTQKVVDQACRYNLILQVPYLLLTNGRQELCCRVEMTEKRLVGLEKVPEWHKKC